MGKQPYQGFRNVISNVEIRWKYILSVKKFAVLGAGLYVRAFITHLYMRYHLNTIFPQNISSISVPVCLKFPIRVCSSESNH